MAQVAETITDTDEDDGEEGIESESLIALSLVNGASLQQLDAALAAFDAGAEYAEAAALLETM